MTAAASFLDSAISRAGILLGAGWAERGAVIMAVAFIALFAFIWAIFIRKPEDRGHHRHRHHWRQPRTGADVCGHNRRRWRLLPFRRRHRRRRRERPSNPTLAETGGLPAIRGAESPPPTDSV